MRKTPHYIITLKNELIEHLDAKIEKEVDRQIGFLAVITAKEFGRINTRLEEMATKEDIKDMATKEDIRDMATKEDIRDMATKEDIRDMATKEDIRDMATKHDVKEILAHIGRYEIRAQNTEDILLQDHKPRIADLEKEVFA